MIIASIIPKCQNYIWKSPVINNEYFDNYLLSIHMVMWLKFTRRLISVWICYDEENTLTDYVKMSKRLFPQCYECACVILPNEELSEIIYWWIYTDVTCECAYNNDVIYEMSMMRVFIINWDNIWIIWKNKLFCLLYLLQYNHKWLWLESCSYTLA